MRAVELDERLFSQERGHWSAPELLAAATVNGHRSLGFEDAGSISVGARADLVAVRLDSVRTVGTGASMETAVFAASAADVAEVVAGGVHLVAGGNHLKLDVAAELAASIGGVTPGKAG
jgi:cytosine/adenosine deaminase-related metal-dependent hydrolase